MNSNCEYVKLRYCMYSICQAVEKAKKDIEKITKEEMGRIFSNKS